jgi:hypothetical protein
MSLETRLRKAAVEATGDDSIIDVAEFEPKGSAGAMVAGAVAGGFIGSGATGGNEFGRAIGTAGGLAAARAATGLSRDLPPYMCVAITPTTVYVLGMKSVLSKKMDAIAQIPRDELGVEVHQRTSVRTVVLEDLSTGAKLALETPRLNLYHGKALVELLMLSDAHHDPEPTDAEHEAADA